MLLHRAQSLCWTSTVGCCLSILQVRVDIQWEPFYRNILCIFSSTIKFLTRRSVSTKVEQFTEISLNISGSHLDNYIANPGDSQIPILSLVDCLEQFTRAEHLGSTVKIECSKCNIQQESTKQLTVNKLPIVICFHLKVRIKVRQLISRSMFCNGLIIL